MAPPILKLDDITLTFGVTPLLNGANLQVEPGDRICLVGRNGSGKSTLMKIAAGLVEAQSGEIFRHPSATIRYLDQAPDFAGYETVQAYAEAGLGPGDDAYRVTYLLEHLGLTGQEHPSSLSGGEARRAALVRVMAPEPDILMLDEPTNHLDLPTIEWLEGELQQTRSALVLISHDRRFLEKVSTATVWLDRGQARRLSRGFGHFEEWRDKVLEEEELEQHKLGKAIEREEHWMRYGVTARRKRNMRRVGELQAMRADYRGHKGPTGSVQATAAEGRESGKLVIEADQITKAYGERTIVAPFSLRVHRGDCIGFVGPNGAGKTTLLKMLTGQLKPDSGWVKLGTNLEVATLDQKREDLNPNDTLAHYLTDGRGENLLVNGELKHVTGYMKDFLFQPEQARTPIRNLSGGERARLMLARILARPTNLLILDEPTNDLDIETLDLLQEIVAGFSGTVILVSHDRDFLDRTVTSTIAPANPDAPDGRWIEYAGGYSDMMAQRKGASDEKKKAEKQEKAKSASSAGSEPTKAKGKLSFKQKFALENLPKEMEKTQAEIAEREQRMADPNLFAKNPTVFNTLANEMSKLREKLETMEEEWLELEMLREELEN
ncbi:ABC-F family ATP-binding cassette domain-containing protein [Agrobacterium rubi]|uniref:ABC-F family ATP-binding cassette domain-containing protein n=1 Tax=Agrobacterium rubi TaxID=28099 RepID=A0AAE7R7U9_9HYPH|nr:ABC-F family ATP-binding cassette domain-containing protein [Agrobacterium rubi]NTE87682.1 ABC-F family ATP-binding cassette domain-containing protein [Agrobacterium rubi]NTF03536.1 ABC-F family ATP-binding cassette domain-containing protein [Agrobacterium rubi]NTF37696.1 ABC-F family ATP-binding cassette domain-containing protein [Agrobacterium rubi]OCJ45622.1 elongation factor 3 [Agrobacterium rubi]QTG00141.1 ABC-F family ATP-binding cassette domain-containing protein [Agrobacterium rubi]